MREIDLPYTATPDDIAKLRALVGEVRATFDRRTTLPRCRIFVTPVGLPYRDEIDRRLADLDLKVIDRVERTGWAALSSAMQVHWTDEPGLVKACAFEALWRHLYPADTCLAYELATVEDFSRFWIEKLGMRAEMGAEIVQVKTPQLSFRAKLHPFHSAEPGQLAIESAWLDRV